LTIVGAVSQFSEPYFSARSRLANSGGWCISERVRSRSC